MSIAAATPIRAAFVAAMLSANLVPAVRASIDPTESDATMMRGSPLHSLGTGYSRTLGSDGVYRVSTRFTSFDGDALRVGFTLDLAASRAAARNFGISRAELDALVDSCVRARNCDQATLDRHLARYYNDRGLRMKQRRGEPTRLFVDVPQAVHRNRAHVKPLAAALRRLAAEHGREPTWAVEAAVALVQTGLPYRQPGDWENGRKIVGFYPPARALEQGYGDCDTKSALLASVLSHLTSAKLVGVRVPKHYLLGIAATPEPGQAFIEHDGRRYVLVEAAGPALRRPGNVADTTLAALRTGKDVRIDPI